MNSFSSWLSFLAVVILFALHRYWPMQRGPRETTYRVTVKFAHGIKTRLTLSPTQYEQFAAWLNQPDGIWTIGDDSAMVTLDRAYVVSVEMKRK